MDIVTALFNNLVSLLWVGLGLGLVIFFHELGHFAVAKWCDVHVERFSIGFGSILWSRQRGETEYALSAIPFGGYVKMLGQDDMDPGQMSNEEIVSNPRSYPAKSVGQRMAIISAGVIMNIITGLMFFAIAYRIGVPVPSASVGYTVAGSPAWKAGLAAGDRITRINDEPINSFMDVTINVTLTSGDIQVNGIRKNGEEFSALIAPDTSGTRRTIGVGPQQGLRIYPLAVGDEPRVAQPNSAAEAAGFKGGDLIVSVDDQPVTNYAELENILARRRSEELSVVVEEPNEEAPEQSGATRELTLKPDRFQSLGLWMDLGTISDVRSDSIAEKAGLKVGDKIVRVAGQEIGTDINPLRLPDIFADAAGSDVEVEIRRQEPGSGDKSLTLTVSPLDIPGWVARPQVSPSEPLAIESLGIALPIIPRVVHVVPGSPAEEKGIKPNDIVTYVILEPNKDAPDELKEEQLKIDLAPEPVDGKSPEPVNWAFAFWRMQLLRARDVQLTIKSGDVKKDYTFTSDDRIDVEDWFSPHRGMYLEGEQVLQKSDTLLGAAGMGLSYTKNTASQIYLTLRSLFLGDMSSRELHGPIGIFSVGVQIAKQGLSKLLMFLGFLSVNLAVLNFLPIPVLDGGHMVFLIWEAVTRRKPSERIMTMAMTAGGIFIVCLMLYVVFLDIFVHWLGVM